MLGTILIWLVLGFGILLLAAHLFTRLQAARAERLVPQVGEIRRVSGGALNYLDTGNPNGPVLVMIHGLSGQLQHCTYALAGELENDFRLIIPDRPGCGYSTRDHRGLGELPEQARMIWELLDQLEVEQPVLVGHSLGGAVSLAMAVARPDRVAGLALLCPATMPQTEPPKMFKALEIRTEWLRALLGQTIAVPGAMATRDTVLGAVAAPDPIPEDFMIRGGAQLGYRPSAYVTASEDMAGYEATIDAQVAQYGTLTMPRAVLFGSDDAVLSPQAHGAALKDFGFDAREVEGWGHMFPMTRPAETAAFIREVAGAAPATAAAQ